MKASSGADLLHIASPAFAYNKTHFGNGMHPLGPRFLVAPPHILWLTRKVEDFDNVDLKPASAPQKVFEYKRSCSVRPHRSLDNLVVVILHESCTVSVSLSHSLC